ncbi:hypothetical protein N7468_006571 [Penicillium chermesinum]|uniref:N-alpha-acetyltransferase 40 n=1 Tax=Penicillium chermesinum TaxID=63820 RepID=A0A9W9NSH3_9EURO|nr:uncharacterized protein N7468_006571 [Penicillium chermesinum]KAJ5225346.1 hypothetical protein N7468_006571 [Penicillium chermesinum]KAJ6161428.1 hypothetical protein N7470_004824 [Penicillium chermesinum]
MPTQEGRITKSKAQPKTGRKEARSVRKDVYSAKSISAADLEACLDLVELTSSAAYAASTSGWSRPRKRKEMLLPDMKFLIVRDAGCLAGTPEPVADRPNASGTADGEWEDEDEGGVLGFLSFMVTYEDGKEVVYCYEIHLATEARGKGIGGLLMSTMEGIGRLIGLEKAMLTVFRSNTAARQFYEKGGYEVDEYSPKPRRLRNGTVKEADYFILSKQLN